MSALQVHIDTLETRVCTWQGYNGPITKECPTIEVSICGDRRRVRCSTHHDDRITILELAVRFSQGSKVWPGSAIYWRDSGNVSNLTPLIDRRGHFALVGYSADYEDKPIRSQHNAVA